MKIFLDNNEKESYSEILIVTVLTVIMFRIPVTHYFCLYNYWYFSYIAQVIYVLSAVLLVAVVFRLWVCRGRIRLSRYEILFPALITLLCLSRYNALNRQKALYGEGGRNEGLFMLLCYYLMFYATRLINREKLRRYIIHAFTYFMFAHAVYGIAQHWAVQDAFVPVIDHYFYAISGVAGNPNFMGTLMVMATSAAIGMCIYSKHIIIKVLYGALIPVFTFTLIYTKTMSGLVGVAMVALTVFLLLLQAVYRKKGRKPCLIFALSTLILGVAAVVIADKVTYGVVFAEINGVINQLKNGINWETVASGRFMAWGNIFKMVPQYWLFGLGIDGLKQPYYQTFGRFLDSVLDKAHNELIQILITMGLPAMILYILLYAFVFKDLAARIKAKTNPAVDTALLLVAVGYLTQAMFNISVIDVAPYFWMLLGLASKPLLKEK